MQNDFCLSDGCLYVKGAESLVPTINRVKNKFALSIFTKCWHPADHKSFAENHNMISPDENGGIPRVNTPWGEEYVWPTHCIHGTEGAKIYEELQIGDEDLILEKGVSSERESYSAFKENDRVHEPTFRDGRTLAEVLKNKGMSEVYVCGVATDFCVGATALDSAEYGFNTFLVEDASAGSNCRLVEKMREKLIQKGITMVHSSKVR